MYEMVDLIMQWLVAPVIIVVWHLFTRCTKHDTEIAVLSRGSQREDIFAQEWSGLAVPNRQRLCPIGPVPFIVRWRRLERR